MEIFGYAHLLFLGGIVYGHGICPDGCGCSLDERGRRQVACTGGGMTDPIPVAGMDREVEVLLISAPNDAPNFLTIGPIFQQFTRLEELHVVRSNLPAIGRHSFWGVPSLEILNLAQNNISHVLEHNFRGLVNLLELRLDENRIESMPSETFRHLQELKILNLSNNRIRELVPRIFLMLGKLRELDLSRNPLTDLNPEVFKDVQGLRKFACRACRLSNVNALVYRLLADLTELDLAENEFEYILSDEFNFLRKLQVLRLEGNRLAVVLDDTFGSVGENSKDLRTIDLSRNRLAKVTVRAFANLSTLRVLDLSYNKLDGLDPGTFLPLADSLRTLNLSGNSVPASELESVVRSASKLRHLALADVGLTDLPPDLFSHHEHLKFLNLSGNRFSRPSPRVLASCAMTRIRTLDLSRNRFRGLSEKALSRLEKIENLALGGNPWACDSCHVPAILRRANGTTMAPALKDLTCKSPYALAGRTVSGLRTSELRLCAEEDESSSADEENAGAVGVPRNLSPGEAGTAGLAVGLLAAASGLAAGACAACRHRRRPGREGTKRSSSANSSTTGGDPVDGTRKAPDAEASETKKTNVSIATIDEIAKRAEFRVLSRTAVPERGLFFVPPFENRSCPVHEISLPSVLPENVTSRYGFKPPTKKNSFVSEPFERKEIFRSERFGTGAEPKLGR